MDIYEIGARVRRGRWGVWAGGLLLAVDGLIVPIWTLWFIAWIGGGSGSAEVMGMALPAWLCLAAGPMAILSIVAVVALLRAPAERGFRVASSVAIAWIAFVGIAWVTGALPVEAFIGRVVVLALLVQGRTMRPRRIAVL